jgi:hypothetical protein
MEAWYVFNDLHAVMAMVGAGRYADARAVTERLERLLDATDGAGRSNVAMTRIGLPACRGVIAYGEGRDHDVLDALLPVRGELHRFGGSHAQRDAMQRTIVAAAIRARRYELAAALLNERLAIRETNVYALRRLADVKRATTDVDGGREAEASAVTYRDRFRAAH